MKNNWWQQSNRKEALKNPQTAMFSPFKKYDLRLSDSAKKSPRLLDVTNQFDKFSRGLLAHH